MSSTILVTGGTGTLGQLVVPRLRDAGAKVRVLSRRSREAAEGIEFVAGDLDTGEGIDAAVAGAEVIVHCAGAQKGDGDKARTLVRAASRAGASHLVNVSVVGADRIPLASGIDRAMFGYFGAKLDAERVVADSGLPWTTLRATQFYDLVLTVARQMARLPVIPVPAGVRFQPVDAGEVAARLAELALGPRRPGAGHGRTAGVPDGRAAPRLPAGRGQAPAAGAGAAPRPGGPRRPGRGKSGSRTSRGAPDLGRVPRRAGESLVPGTVKPEDEPLVAGPEGATEL